jgi:nicotinamidase-related amidase
MNKIDEYIQALKTGNKNYKVEGLSGRIIRGLQPEDFTTLTEAKDIPDRQIVFILGPEELQALIGQTGYDMLSIVGYEQDYDDKINKGYQFKLIVFPDTKDVARLGTWDNLLDMIKTIHPNLATDIEKYREDLIATNWDVFEEEFKNNYGVSFLDVEKLGEQDFRFMTIQKYFNGYRKLLDFRALIYYSICHCRKLYQGNGWTFNPKLGQNVREYIIPNRRIDTLGEYRMIDLDIKIPGQNQQNKNIGGIKMLQNSLVKTKYEEIVSESHIGSRENPINLEQLLWENALYEDQLTPAVLDPEKVALFLIDMQNCFMKNGSLPVENSLNDVQNVCRFAYRGMHKITRMFATFDTQPVKKSTHPCAFIDKNGKYPNQIMSISIDDIDNGTWDTTFMHKDMREYLNGLKNTPNANPHMIWPFHGLPGTFGWSLEQQLANIIYYHSAARKSDFKWRFKGMDSIWEMYGAFRADYDGGKNIIDIELFNILMSYNKIYFAGQAKDFCVSTTIEQFLEYFANRPDITSKVYILVDCMSCAIPGNEDKMNQKFDEWKKKYNINIVKSTDVVF